MPAALIHALTVMEIALVPLLYFMLKDASSALKKVVDIRAMVEKISRKKKKVDQLGFIFSHC